MGEWIGDTLYYFPDDIGNIIEYGHSEHSDDIWDAIGERADVRRAMDELKIRRHLYWDANNYQSIADYLNGYTRSQ